MGTQTTQRTDDTKAWMANRNREVGARGRDAEAAGYAAFGVAARTGAPFTAPRSSDVITIGAQQLAAPRPTPRDDFDEFRRQQAEFTKMQHEEQRKNAWFAVPALAPVLAVAGAEAAGWVTARALGQLPFAPPRLPGPQPRVPQVTLNRIAGNQFRDEISAALRAEGREVRNEVHLDTPFGKRVMDAEIWLDKVRLGGLETKVGDSRYLASQQIKDWWLKVADKYPVHVIRNK